MLTVSATEGEGLDTVRDAISAGQTAVLIGASGAGKSTLVNALMGREVMTTSEVRDCDRKGRHTTTSRQLFTPPWGAMLIDTPGTRELGLVVDDGALDASFDDVAALADGCRYRDCAHESEPGCAVQRAVGDGALSAARPERGVSRATRVRGRNPSRITAVLYVGAPTQPLRPSSGVP